LVDWWTKKYNLPRNHELLLTRSPASLLREMLDDLVDRRAALTDMLDDKHADRKAVVEQLASLNEMLGILDDPNVRTRHRDPTVEEWEAAAIRGGPMPVSFTQGLPKTRKKPQNR